MLCRNLKNETISLMSSHDMSMTTAGNSNSVSLDQAGTDDVSVCDSTQQKSDFRTTLRHFLNIWSRSLNSVDDQTNPDPVEENGGPEFQNISWSSEIDLIIHCIGFSVGLGNLWRFPYVAFKNGGGAFLIPYLILTFVISIPLFYVELFIGQNSKLDPLTVWTFCPFFKGLGLTIVLCTLVIQVYYNVIMTYALFYWAQTFREVLPWSGCFEWWGADENCYEIKEGPPPCKIYPNTDENTINCTNVENDINCTNVENTINCTNASVAASDQFLKKYVLGISSGLDDPGTIKWDLALTLMATWIVVGALVIGRHHTRLQLKFKTIYVTAFFPFIVLTVYFLYTITLPGSTQGLNKLFIPKWSKLLDITVWSEAAQSSMYSTGLGVGGLVIFGGKNDFHYNISRCAIVSCLVDTFAGVLAAAVTFMVVGFLAELLKRDFSEITFSGYGLVFTTFPDAVMMMHVSHLWAFIFFAMLFCLAVDSSVATTEVISLGIRVLFPLSKPHSKLVTVFCSMFLFLLGLSCVTNGGAFLLNLLDFYVGGYTLMGTVLLQSVAFGWGYGIQQASLDIEKMQGSEPSIFMKLCWVVLAPISLIIIFLYSIKSSYLSPLYDIPYPSYAYVLGWIIVGLILLPVPVWMMLALFQHRKDIRNAFKPEKVWKKAVLRVQNNIK